MRCKCCKLELCFKCEGHLTAQEMYRGTHICGTCVANFIVMKMIPEPDQEPGHAQARAD